MKWTPSVNICGNPTPKGYSRLNEARVFRQTFFQPLSVKTSFTRFCGTSPPAQLKDPLLHSAYLLRLC